MNIDELEAGRELDALVAEKVMKCKTATKEWNGVLHPFCCCDGSDHEQRCTYVPGMLAYYSTDIAAAWEVVERFDNFSLSRAWSMNGQKVGVACWLAGGFVDLAATAPLAICRAALKAVGVETVEL